MLIVIFCPHTGGEVNVDSLKSMQTSI